MRRKIISVLMALCIVVMYTGIVYADDNNSDENVKEVTVENTSNPDSNLGDNTPDSEESNEEQLEVKDAHFFVRIDRVVQHEDGNTHYEAKNYFPVGAVAEGYKYGSNSSDYASVDGKVKKTAYISVEGKNITDEMKTEAQEKIYSQMIEYPSKEDVIAAAKAYCKACGVEMNLENVDVLWYVIKDEGKTHVDGVLYNVKTGEVVQAEEKKEDNTGDNTGGNTGEPERTPDPEGTRDIPDDRPVIVPEGTEVEPLEADTFTIKVVYVDERGEVIGSDEWVFNEGKGDYAIPVDWNEWFLRGEDSVPDASEAYVEGEYLGFAWWESAQKDRLMTVYLCKSADESDAAPFGDAEALSGDSDDDWVDTPASDGVQTGDEITMTFYWLMLIAVIALVIIGCLVIRRMDE